MTSFQLPRPQGFRLQAAADFYAGFTPGSGMAALHDAAHRDDGLTLAFRLDGSFAPVVAALREEPNGRSLAVECAGTDDLAAVGAQLGRILGLEVDGARWLEVGERDPVVGRLQGSFPGFFTAAKSSPYDAATWAVIAPRMNMAQAARIKVAMARTLGDAVTLRGKVHHVFPGPAALARVERVEGLAEEKVARLRGVARAALEGRLDAGRLRALPEDVALAELQTLRGVGPWAASHIYYRGAAPTDALPSAEPRVLHGLALAYGLEAPTMATFARLAEAWRPFRMWVAILLSRHLAGTDGWRAPELARERAAAGRALERRTRGRSASRPTLPGV